MLEANLLFVHLSIQSFVYMLEGNLLFVHLSIQTIHVRGQLIVCSFKYTNDMLEGNLLFIHSSIQTTIVYSD